MTQHKDTWGEQVYSDQELNEFTIRSTWENTGIEQSSTIASLARELLRSRTELAFIGKPIQK